MQKKSLVILLVLAALLLSAAFALHGKGAAGLHHWFAEMHGRGGH